MGRREKAGLSAHQCNFWSSSSGKLSLLYLEQKLVDPQEKGLFLDRKFILGLDKNSGNGEASILAVGACLVRFSMDASRVMTKAEMSGVGTSVCDPIIQHFLLHFGPDSVGKQKNVLHLGLGVLVKEIIAGPASNAAAQPAKEILCLWKVCGRYVGWSQCWTAITSLGHRRRLLVIVLDTSIERCCCWLLSETR